MVDVVQKADYRGFQTLSIGTVISKTFRVFFQSPFKFLILGGVTVLPLVLGQIYVMDNPRSAAIGSLSIIPQIFLAYAIQASIAYATFQLLRARPFVFGESLMVGFKRFIPIILAVILTLLITMVGFILLLIPGLIASCALAVVIPACTIERLGPGASVSRSAALTKGSRWRVLGAIFVLNLPFIIILGLFGFFAKAVGGSIAGLVAQNAVQAVFQALNAVMIAVLYYELRSVKDGVDIDRIADVFA